MPGEPELLPEQPQQWHQPECHQHYQPECDRTQLHALPQPLWAFQPAQRRPASRVRERGRPVHSLAQGQREADPETTEQPAGDRLQEEIAEEGIPAARLDGEGPVAAGERPVGEPRAHQRAAGEREPVLEGPPCQCAGTPGRHSTRLTSEACRAPHGP